MLSNSQIQHHPSQGTGVQRQTGKLSQSHFTSSSPEHVALQCLHAGTNSFSPHPGGCCERGDDGSREKDWEHRAHPTNTVCVESAFLLHPAVSQELLLVGVMAPFSLSPCPLQERRTGPRELLHSPSALLSQGAAPGQGKHVKVFFQLARSVEGVQPCTYTAGAQVCGRESRVSRQHRTVNRGLWAWRVLDGKLSSE